MTITAGVLSLVLGGSTTMSLAATAATAGTGPYTYQWYRSTTSGFTVGSGNIIAGATALTLDDTGLIPGTVYYWKVVATDTGHSNDTAEYTQLSETTTGPVLSPNQFGMTSLLGVIDLRYDFNTVSCQVDTSQATALVFGQAVKVVDSAGGIPKVIACAANSDVCAGFINFDIKSPSFPAGSQCEVSMSGNVMFLYATTAIARFAIVSLDITTIGGVRSAAGNTGDRTVGYAYDKAALGDLIRVVLNVGPQAAVV